MNIEAEKLDLIKWLAQIDDSKIIKQFMLIKKSNEETGAVSLSQEEKEAINKGLKSISEGHHRTHVEVKEESKKKYPNLYR
jgi:predicted transcriptional regulator